MNTANLALKSRIVAKYGTQVAFAKQVQATETLVSRVIRGHICLSDEKKERWARALDAGVAEIFPGTGG